LQNVHKIELRYRFFCVVKNINTRVSRTLRRLL